MAMGMRLRSGGVLRRAGLPVWVVLGWVSLAVGPAVAEQQVRIVGSDTMLILNQELTARYGEDHPEVKFTVLGGGSETGIDALMAGKTDIAAASRPMKRRELERFEKRTGQRPMEVVIALDGVGVYVHNANPITRLTMVELAKILSGEIANWKEVRGVDRRIDIYNRDKNSGTRTFMQAHVLNGQAFSKRSMDVSSTALVTASVSRNQSAIGYGGIAYAEGTRIIRLATNEDEAGFWPSRENVSTGKYPLSRPLHYYINPASMNEHVRGYLDWVLSEPGQEAVTFVGYFPAPKGDGEAGNSEAEAVDGEEAAPREPAGPVVLSKANMAEHGFDLSLEMGAEAGQGDAETGRIPMRLRLGGETAADRFDSIELHLGEAAVIPLQPSEAGVVSFALRRSAIEQTSVHLAEPNAPEEGRAFIVPLAAFAPEP